MTNKNEELFITCDCYAEGIRAVYDPDDKLFYVSLWKPRTWGDISWGQRFRHIWYIIKTGEPWGDEVVLNHEEAGKLASWMLTQKPSNK